MSLCTEKTTASLIDIPELLRWPEQEPLTFTHKSLLDFMFSKQKTLISEYSFSGLFLFADMHKYQISHLHSTVIVTGKDAQGPFAIFPCSLPTKEAIQQLQQSGHYLKALSYRSVQQAQEFLKHIGGHKVVAREGDFDYMYKRSNLHTLPGRKFHKKRNLVNHFMHKHAHHTTVDITTERLNDVLYLLQKWVTVHHADTDNDYLACKKAIIYYENLELLGQITYVNDTPAGFVIGELRNNKNCAVIHFEKADINYVGIYQHINQQFVKSLPEECKVINREQDLGKEGLRQAKLTYRPDALLKKYRVYFHETPGRN